MHDYERRDSDRRKWVWSNGEEYLFPLQQFVLSGCFDKLSLENERYL